MRAERVPYPPEQESRSAPGYRPLVLLAMLALPLLFFAIFFQVATHSFEKLGLTPAAGLLLLLASVAGSVVNIPIWRQRVVRGGPFRIVRFPFLFSYPPRVEEQIIYVNLGGAIIPATFSLYLMARTPLAPVVVATALVAAVVYRLARPMPEVGIVMPAFVPPLVAAGAAMLLTRTDAATVAYIAGVVGTIVGADLLHLPEVRRMGSVAMSIGGAGVYDGVFLVGIVAAVLA